MWKDQEEMKSQGNKGKTLKKRNNSAQEVVAETRKDGWIRA